MNLDTGTIFVVSILLVVAIALSFAALYTVYGSPTSTAGKKRKRHIVSGFQLAGGVLLGLVLVGTFVAAMGVAFFGNPARFSSKPLAFVLATISLALISLMAQRWAKYFAGWIGYGALNGLLMATSGHLVNNPAMPVRRSVALMMTGAAIISALVCLRFTKGYPLNLVDRIALIAWIVFFAIAANAEQYGLLAMTLGCAGLVLAWLYHHSFRRHQVYKIN